MPPESASTIGRGTVVRGTVHGEGDLEILGRVEGSVSVSGELSIGETALIKSDVSGWRVIVRGAVAGNVSATESILLEAGARVVGDLGAPQIGIRPGALVRGLVSTGVPLAASAAAMAGATRTRPAPAATVAKAPVPSRAAAPVRQAAARPAPTARPTPAPAPRPRVEAPAISPRAEPQHVEEEQAHPTRVEQAEPQEEESSAGEHGEQDEHGEHGGPPPPVVPQIRKGAKASLRRKGAR
jgi:cytoskeletal protein CcmA (bactofilin family)